MIVISLIRHNREVCEYARHHDSLLKAIVMQSRIYGHSASLVAEEDTETVISLLGESANASGGVAPNKTFITSGLSVKPEVIHAIAVSAVQSPTPVILAGLSLAVISQLNSEIAQLNTADTGLISTIHIDGSQ